MKGALWIGVGLVAYLLWERYQDAITLGRNVATIANRDRSTTPRSERERRAREGDRTRRDIEQIAGSTVAGAGVGAAAGPWGALIGGIGGGIAGVVAAAPWEPQRQSRASDE